MTYSLLPPKPPFKTAWLPIDGPRWQVVDSNGNALHDEHGRTYFFKTEEAALAFIKGREWQRRHDEHSSPM